MRSLWADLVRSRAFWVSYVCAGVDFIGCPSLQADVRALWGQPTCGATLTLNFPHAHTLCLQISAGEHRLEHFHPDYEGPLLVGTMDCHQESDLFRWDEFRAVVRHLSKNSGPAWAYELLLSFYVAVNDECAVKHAALLQGCLQASEVFSGQEVEHILAYTRHVAVRQDFRWIDTPDLGWVAEGRDAYSMRHTPGGFDFARFGRFLTAVGADA